MYILKNALLNIKRKKGKNILIGIIITIITISSCISLTINKSGKLLVDSYKEKTPLEVSFQLNPMNLKEASDEDKENFKALDIELVNSIGKSSLVKDYYYSLEVSMSSSQIEAIDYSKLEISDSNNNFKPKDNKKITNMGDFRFTSYSDFSYLNDFINGTKKIIEGEFIDNDSDIKQVIISEDLSKENDLTVGDTIKFYYPDDEEAIYNFTVVGIFSDTSSVEDNSFMEISAMNSRNQIYVNLSAINEIVEDNQEEVETGYKQMISNGLTARFILNDPSDLNAFNEEAKSLGLNDYYNAITNEEEILTSLKPIQNITDFSFVFLIVILVVGAIILTIINVINIRDRKYEIGVLRAIGMSKFNVTLQFVLEIFIIALVSLVIGTTTGTLSSQFVTNMMLKNEISSYQQEQTAVQENFGNRGNFGSKPGNVNNTLDKIINAKNANYIDSLTVSTDMTTILQLFLVSLALTMISGVIAVSFVNKYEPNKILQNRN